MRRALLPTLVLTFLAGTADRAKADYIFGVTATSNMGSGFGTQLINTVNGNGLSSRSLTATHASTAPFNSWVSATNQLTGAITFNLGGSYLVDRFSFWNQNAGGPGAQGSTGIQNVQVQYSPDGLNFLNLPGGPSSFARVTLGGPAAPQTFSFAPVQASAFRFNVLSNWGFTTNTGFAEVAFNSANVPEPASLLVLGALAPAACFLGRRRAKAAPTAP